jgi:hypothetical protein
MRGVAMKYDVEVTREGRWWMISIPALDGLTQARRLDEVEDMARSYISVDTDAPPSTVELGKVSIWVGTDEVNTAHDEIAALRAEARAAEERAAERAREVANRLAAADVPVRDIAAVLGVSHQRVSQLVNG